LTVDGGGGEDLVVVVVVLGNVFVDDVGVGVGTGADML